MNAADALLEKGATDVYAYITHGVLSGGAVARITASQLKELVITDSIQPTEAVQGRTQYPGALGLHADRRGDRTHRRRGVGLEPVRLTPPLQLRTSPTLCRCAARQVMAVHASCGRVAPISTTSLTIAGLHGTLSAGIRSYIRIRQ